MKDHLLPAGAGASGFLGVLYALGEFSIHNLDVVMAALGPIAFRVAPRLPAVDAETMQRIYVLLAIVSAGIALVTLARRAYDRITS